MLGIIVSRIAHPKWPCPPASQDQVHWCWPTDRNISFPQRAPEQGRTSHTKKEFWQWKVIK